MTASRTVVFYEKPGCAGNRRQKALLQEHGINLDVRDLSAADWSPEQLEAFFGERDNSAIVNTSSPKIKSGEVDPSALSREALLQRMVSEPLLIKRPLLEVGDEKVCGFDIPRLNALLGIEMPIPEDINSCQKTDKCSGRHH